MYFWFVALILVLPWNGLISPSLCDEFLDEIERMVNQSIADAIAYKEPKDASEFRPTSDEVIVDETKYDFIIVGAGASGAVLARRLSEWPSKQKVLVLESGDFENNFTDIIGLNTYLRLSKYNWGYYTTPQTTMCLGNCTFLLQFYYLFFQKFSNIRTIIH